MKKTIAILLVLVIGMVGVFAAEAQLDLSLTVVPITQIYVSNAIGDSPENYTAFMALVSEDAVNGTAVALQSTAQTVGKLHYMTNIAAGTTVKMGATLLTGSINTNTSTEPEATATYNTIGYSVEVNDVTVVASAAATPSSAIALPGTNGVFTIASHDIDVTLVKADYENAAADTYTASIYFNFTTP